MTDERKISICIPTYSRVDMTIDSFIDVYNDERVSEIVIVDDASDLKCFDDLDNLCSSMSKVKLYRNKNNLDCYNNKRIAVGYTSNDWCVLLDSDNKIDKMYLDVIFSFPAWASKTILTPSFAKPEFDFRKYEGLLIGKNNISSYIDKPLFETCLNACNYFVNKNEYINIWHGGIDPITSDSIYFISRWLEAGNNLYIVPSLHYEHRVHEGSHYKNNVSRTPKGFHESILNKLRQLT